MFWIFLLSIIIISFLVMFGSYSAWFVIYTLIFKSIIAGAILVLILYVWRKYREFKLKQQSSSKDDPVDVISND